MNMSTVELKVLKVNQPIGEFYIGAINPRKLNEIATVEIREFREGNPDDLAGIQRELSVTRVNKLGEYVNFDYATFPTSVVIAIDERCTTLEEVDGCEGLFTLYVHDSLEVEEGDDEYIHLEESAFIIDGQHRLAGIKKLENNRVFDINVSIFIGADLADKAEIFSKVNLTQTKVNRSLVYDLFTYADKPSPFKMAHEITVALNKDPKGPLSRKIKRLGKATPGLGKTETLAQATVVNGLLRYFPKNPEKERNKGFLGLSREKEPGENWKNKPFSYYYRRDDATSIFKILTNYFNAVADKWPNTWTDVEEGFILNRTTGYVALIRFFQPAYISITDEPRIVTESEFSKLFEKIKIKSSELTAENFLPGGSGESALYKRLLLDAKL